MLTVQHLNGHLLCAIDVETTGLNYFEDEIVEIAIVPVGFDLRPHKKLPPFDMLLLPANPEKVSAEIWNVTGIHYDDVLAHGMDPYNAADLFCSWFDQLKLSENKRICPLAHNWAFDSGFIRKWLGNATYSQYFDGRYRDTMCQGLFIDDQADVRTESYPFAKVKLSYMASQYKIDTTGAHRALNDCLTTMELYRKLVHDPKFVGQAFRS